MYQAKLGRWPRLLAKTYDLRRFTRNFRVVKSYTSATNAVTSHIAFVWSERDPSPLSYSDHGDRKAVDVKFAVFVAFFRFTLMDVIFTIVFIHLLNNRLRHSFGWTFCLQFLQKCLFGVWRGLSVVCNRTFHMHISLRAHTHSSIYSSAL